MKAGEVCINDIFNGARLIEVPFYQRAYVWKEEQWERFLTDMEYVSDTQRHYFLGSIILKNGETPNMTDAFSNRKIIIDGQQRKSNVEGAAGTRVADKAIVRSPALNRRPVNPGCHNTNPLR